MRGYYWSMWMSLAFHSCATSPHSSQPSEIWKRRAFWRNSDGKHDQEAAGSGEEFGLEMIDNRNRLCEDTLLPPTRHPLLSPRTIPLQHHHNVNTPLHESTQKHLQNEGMKQWRLEGNQRRGCTSFANPIQLWPHLFILPLSCLCWKSPHPCCNIQAATNDKRVLYPQSVVATKAHICKNARPQ